MNNNDDNDMNFAKFCMSAPEVSHIRYMTAAGIVGALAGMLFYFGFFWLALLCSAGCIVCYVTFEVKFFAIKRRDKAAAEARRMRDAELRGEVLN